MNKNILIILAILIALFSCNKEDDLIVKEGKGWYNFEDDANDVLKHYVYEFSEKYGVSILTNPEEKDYRYNFTSVNPIKLVAPEQDNELLMKAIGLLEKIFIDEYEEEFKKKHFPYTIQLADSIKVYDGDKFELRDIFVGHNFIAIGNINDGIYDLSDEEIEALRIEINKQFWVNCIVNSRGAINLPGEFNFISKDYYEKQIPFSFVFLPRPMFFNHLYSLGFVGYDENSSSFLRRYPDPKLDMAKYFEFIFSKTPEEIAVVTAMNENVKIKLDMIKEILLEDFNFDIENR